MIEFPIQLESIMAERNFHIKGNINYSITGKFQRFSSGKKYKRAKDLFVVLHDYDRGATFGDWHYPDDWFTYWNKNYEKPSLIELKKIKEEFEKIKVEAQYKRSKAEWRARELWHKYYVEDDASEHDYVKRKNIIPYYASKVRSWLLVPISDIEHRLITLQIIKPNGFKRLWKGTSPKDLMIWLHHKLIDLYDDEIYVCEGYATGCTIKELTSSPVICAINSINLIKVCILLRRKFFHAKIKICADNDKWGDDNIGLKHARQAATIIKAPIYYPVFDGFKTTQKLTDFNDLYNLCGHDIALSQLRTARK